MHRMSYEVIATPDRIEFSDGVVRDKYDIGIIDTILAISSEITFEPTQPVALHKALSVSPPLGEAALSAIHQFCTEKQLGNMYDGIDVTSIQTAGVR